MNCIDGGTILKEVLECMIHWPGLSEMNIKNIIHMAANHEKTLNTGSKVIYHLESFAAHVMEELLKDKSGN